MHTDRIRLKDKEESNKYIHRTYLALLVLALANHNAVVMHYGSLVLHRRCREEESNKYIHRTYLALLVLALANHNTVFIHYGSLVLHRRCVEKKNQIRCMHRTYLALLVLALANLHTKASCKEASKLL